ncbi:hypothetical protein PVAP13_8NG081000 [Panicum virgatum]|uniref:F-box domain-containing protein n=1 Tax=Panicum virgatum TaxID=38727 RepID=A0A8T0PB70_PANVG|nr:hypothetical protein PVAP13_8NG081000 [Panicum virgatum]
MPPRRKAGKGRRAAPLGGGRVSIDVLPDEVLHHVLSFLPAQEAVRTCVLALRWRHLWRYATGLRISCNAENEAVSAKKLRNFVDHLFLLRGGSPLDTCQFTLLHINDDNDDMCKIHLWIRHVLLCRVRVLSLDIRFNMDCWRTRFYMDDLPLVSQHLKRLELSALHLNQSFVDFSSCPALEVIQIKECDILDLDRISSRSLKSLSITGYCGFNEDHRIHVYAPNLVSLWLEVFYGRVPFLDRMPSLVEAVVRIDGMDGDFCHHADSGDCEDKDCPGCYGVDGDTGCVLLQSLSEAQSLVLISDTKMFIFRRDLKCCPIFSNLKALSLNEYWCVPDDFSALTCILEHSPVLEKLTLQLFSKGPKSNVQMKGSPDPTERSNVISEHLKTVEIKCEVVDAKVLNVLKFLNKLGICKL